MDNSGFSTARVTCSLARAVLLRSTLIARSESAKYQRGRRELDRRVARAIDNALGSAYLDTSQDMYGLVPQMRLDTFDRRFWDFVEGYLVLIRTRSHSRREANLR